MAISAGWVTLKNPDTNSTATCSSSNIQNASIGHISDRSVSSGMMPIETDGNPLATSRWPSCPAIVSAPLDEHSFDRAERSDQLRDLFCRFTLLAPQADVDGRRDGVPVLDPGDLRGVPPHQPPQLTGSQPGVDTDLPQPGTEYPPALL